MSDITKRPASAGTQQRSMLAKRLRQRRSIGSGVMPGDRKTVFPLSSGQERLWFLERFEGAGALYNLTVSLEFTGRLDVGLLERSINEVVARHDVLRTVVRYVHADESLQQIVQPSADIDLTVCDLSALTTQMRDDAVLRHVRAQDSQPFDLDKGPLLRASSVRLDEELSLLVLTMHHMVTDGWSYQVFLRELSACYAELLGGRAWNPPALGAQYADYVEWEAAQAKKAERQRDLAYWREQLDGMPVVMDLPSDRPRGVHASYAGDAVPFVLAPETVHRVRTFARAQGATPFMVMLGAFKVLLAKYTGQSDVVIGTPTSTRARTEFEDLIGFFVNTLVLRTRLDLGESFEATLSQVRTTCTEAFGRQEVPFGVLVKELQPERSFSHAPLFQVMFSMAGDPLPAWSVEGVQARLVRTGTATTKYDLTIALIDGKGGIEGRIEYSTALFDRSTIERFARHFEAQVIGLLERPMAPIESVTYLSEAEYGRLIKGMATPFSSIHEGGTLHGWVEEQARRTPDAVALIHERTWVTYGELWERAGQLASFLRTLGIGLEDRVGICMEREPEMIVAMLATLRAGGCYVPLDPAYPRERVQYMVDHCLPRVILTLARHEPDLSAWAARLVVVDASQTWQNSAPADVTVDSRQTGYIMYTSGSTGRPKGVCVSHGNAVATLAWGVERFDTGCLAYTAASTSICFDLSVYEIFLPLVAGGAVCLVHDALALASADARHELTLINTVPSAMEALLEQRIAFPRLRVVNLAGESLSRALVERTHAWTGADIFNLYGPSEDTTYSTEARVAVGVESKPSIGRPLPGTVAFVLDQTMQPVAEGLPGELYLGGKGVSRGYYQRPDLTAERYVPNPFGTPAAERLYRTGDLVRVQPDGELQFLGRVDHQVKVRGFRIELDEIQTTLMRMPVVREALVTVHRGALDEPKLVAYLVFQSGAAPTVEGIRRMLREQVPTYMVPTEWIVLDAMPRTPNGKTDRKALPAPGDHGGGAMRQPPRGLLQEMVCSIWREVLGVSEVSADDNFFDIGGHSLLAARVLLRLQRVSGIALPVRMVFEAPTIATLATAVEQLKGALELPPVERLERGQSMPLSFAQHRQWMLHQLDPDSSVYNVPMVLRLSGALDADRLGLALEALAKRHEVLRTTIGSEQGVPFQRVADAGTLSLLRVSTDNEALSRLLADEVGRPFDLSVDPLTRATLFRLTETDHVLALVFHHVVVDGWSLGLLCRDLAKLYVEGEQALPSLPLHYADFAAWHRAWLASGVLEPQLRYWGSKLAGMATLLALATDRPRPPVASHAGAVHRFRLSGSLRAQVEELARQHHATPFMVLLAWFKLYLHRRSGCNDVCVGIPITNRVRPEFEAVAGYFGNTLAVRDTTEGVTCFAGFLERVKTSCLEAYEHQDVPFERVIEHIRVERRSDVTPLFQAMFVMETDLDVFHMELPGVSTQSIPLPVSVAKFDVTLNVREDRDGYAASLVYATALYDASTVARMASHLERLLVSVTAQPSVPLRRLSWLDEVERAQVLNQLCAVRKRHQMKSTLHAVFERVVARKPDAIAVSDGQAQFTYGELDRRANRLAHRLIEAGAKPEARVALVAPRGIDQLIGLLAILKAGAAYLPIDPDYPAERIDYILADSGASLVLVGELNGAFEPPHGHPVIRIGEAASPGMDNAPPAWVATDNTAYVIYTSGSTGRPKGVQVAHGNVLRLFASTRALFGFDGQDVWTMFHSFAFDFSVWEIWGAFLHGGRLISVPYFASREPESFRALLAEQRVTVLNQTPSAFRQLIEVERTREWTDPLALAWVVFGGEALDMAMLREWYDRHPEQPRLVNMYGITETTVHVTHALLKREDSWTAGHGIGVQLEDLALYVLDEELQPVPMGIRGELHVGGAGLATAYLNRPALTAERFVPDPFSAEPGARMYRTGDAGRMNADGNVDYLGRVDEQIKIRGFRIEPGEIRAALLGHPEVGAAVIDAVASEDGMQLVAYVAARDGCQPQMAMLRAYLTGQLPSHMVPATFNLVSHIPLTTNGKVDRRALSTLCPAPEAEAWVPPKTEQEKEVAAIWSEILRRDQVGRYDNFFELGGHSLSATQVLFQVRQRLGVAASLRMLFEFPRLDAFASHLSMLPAQEHLVSAMSRPVPVRRR